MEFLYYLIKGQAPCNQGSIRLQGDTSTTGRVEVCHLNVWGTVCGDGFWGLADSQVACRQLGFPFTGATAHTIYSVPHGTQIRWLRHVSCVGTESSLFNCNVRPSQINCYNPSYSTGVICQDSKSYIF